MLNIFTIINLAANALNVGMNGYSLAGNRKRRKENKAINERLDKLEAAHKTDVDNIHKGIEGIANGMKDMNTKMNELNACTGGMIKDLQTVQNDTLMLKGKLEALYKQPVVQPVQVQQPQVQVQQPQSQPEAK